MSRLTGGIFSRVSGKTGDIVFGAARTRTGKVVTARLLVPPSNPNTALQQTQRSKFKEALAIVRLIGASVYQSDWNRSIGQLPGFQSLQSIYLTALNDSNIIGAIPDINLGSLHPPATISVVAGASGIASVTWSTELGINGTDADVTMIIAVATNPAASPLERVVLVKSANERADGAESIENFIAGAEVSVGLYFQGAGTAEGLLTPCQFTIGNVGA